MEDSFRVRVDKAFGSLEASSSFSSSTTDGHSDLRSLWCLTDDEIERREWNRDKAAVFEDDDDGDDAVINSKINGSFADRQQILMASSLNKPKPPDFRQELESDLQDLEGDGDSGDEEEGMENVEEKQQLLDSTSRQLAKPDDHNSEEWEIRSSVGLDSTLDYEEEEDAYDKVAIGREEAAARLYMREINDYEVDIDSNIELPNRFRDVERDPRANHMAAKIRLKEDDEAAGNFDYSQFSSICKPPYLVTENDKMVDGVNLKPILKRREIQIAAESEKRVRFESGCIVDDLEDGQTKDIAMEESPASLAVCNLPQGSNIPDYILNPSKYTHYTFDSLSDIGEETNQKACMDFLISLKGSITTEKQDGVTTEPPKSVIFTHRRKSCDGFIKIDNELKKNQGDGCKEYANKKGLPPSIAAVEVQDSEVSAMDEDEPETRADRSGSLQKAARQYRMKGTTDIDEFVQ